VPDTSPAVAGAEPNVDPTAGLTSAEAAARLVAHGPNRLPEAPSRSRLRLFFDQFANLLIIILIGAAVLAGLVGEIKDTIVIGFVLVLNATLGYVQESRAEKSLAALRRMLVATAKVRRDGEVQVVSAEELVVGDVVIVDTGDRIPADGRWLWEASVEADESSLTGESTPVAKSVEPVDDAADLGDRTDLAFMNTTITRGRGELEVEAIGSATQIGQLATMLATAQAGPTPLQQQLHTLGKRLAAVAAVAVAAFLTLNLLQGEDLAETLLASVALAVAAIPEGLPAVVTVTLAIGVHQMAKRGAIVKRLASVETLGSTTVICSDKTGTLTLNQMTARALVTGHGVAAVTGSGYGPDGHIAWPDGTDGSGPTIHEVLWAGALCNDSIVRHDDGAHQLVGDPTEGALVALAAKGGVEVEALRTRFPRVGEVPFDSTRKLMATLHEVDGQPVLYVKGAPDVVLGRCSHRAGGAGPVALTAEPSNQLVAEIEELAHQGLRVLGVARRVLDADRYAAVRAADPEEVEDLLVEELRDLELLGLVGLLDPPRQEARDAIGVCHRAGIAVKMITGDHQATATAIARQLGIEGGTLSGRDLDGLDDAQLAAVIDDTGVFARVAPTHKVRIVEALQAKGHVVAMTGDGVNDAPALKTADIGIAMGITGTEVSKEAADMVLTDDDFSTIVRAVHSGRTIYRNIVSFVRFQLSTNVGAILTLLTASATDLPVPFTAIQVLWVNLIMDGPPAMALGVDPPDDRAMEEPPRSPTAAILSGWRLRRIVVAGVVMTIGTLGILAYERSVGTEEHALAMAFTTFVIFQVFNVFNARTETGTVFARAIVAQLEAVGRAGGGGGAPGARRALGPGARRLRHLRPRALRLAQGGGRGVIGAVGRRAAEAAQSAAGATVVAAGAVSGHGRSRSTASATSNSRPSRWWGPAPACPSGARCPPGRASCPRDRDRGVAVHVGDDGERTHLHQARIAIHHQIDELVREPGGNGTGDARTEHEPPERIAGARRST
jgi:P-type Ca2+ transporter type 2C